MGMSECLYLVVLVCASEYDKTKSCVSQEVIIVHNCCCAVIDVQSLYKD